MTDSQLCSRPLALGSFKSTKNVLKHEKEAYEHSIPYTYHCYFQISQELQKTALTESWGSAAPVIPANPETKQPIQRSLLVTVGEVQQMCHCNKRMVQSLQWSNSLICINCQHFLQQINVFPSVSLLCQHVGPF